MSTQRGALYAAGIALLCIVSVLLIDVVDQRIWEAQQQSPVRSLNEEITDLAYRVRGNTGLDSLVQVRDVVIVDIDNASIEALGRVQTWPRTYTARVLQHIRKGAPRAIALDLLYTEPDTLGPAYADLLRDAGFSNPQPILEAFRTDDRLAAALRDAERTYLGFFDAGADPLMQADVVDARACEALLAQALPGAPTQRLIALNRPVLPIEPLRNAAQGIAPIMLHSSSDGTVRHYATLQTLPPAACDPPATAPDGGEGGARALVPSLALRLALDAAARPMDRLLLEPPRLHLDRQWVVPIRSNGTFRINWLGEDESIRRIGYHKVLNERIPAGFFRDKFVFIGASATGVEDLHATPVNDKKPGVEVHAEAFLTLANNAFVTTYSVLDLLLGLAVFACALAALFLAFKPVMGVGLVAGVLGIEFFGYVLYVVPDLNTVLPIGTLMLLTGFVFVSSAVVRYITEERERLRMQEAFAAYVSPAVTELIGEQADRLELGGQKKEMSVLFCDLRDFTPLSESMSPEELVDFLNVYFDILSEALLEEDGTIDKYIGDAIMAFFGAPIDQPDHAARACRGALAMSERLQDVPAPPRLEGTLHMRIGISSGPMVAGNIGASRRFDYTVIGDAVNLGARLEGLNHVFGTTILVSEDAYAGCQDEADTDIVFRSVGRIAVKGKQKAVAVYELMPPSIYPDAPALAERFAEGYDLYHQKRFADAHAVFEACLAMHPGDGPSRYYRDRCAACQRDAAEYSRVIRMTSK